VDCRSVSLGTNKMCGWFFHRFTQKLGQFYCFPSHFAIGRICVHSIPCSCSVYCHLLKYTAFMFPLVNFTKPMCGLFLDCFIQSVKPIFHTLKILKSLQGFQVKIQDLCNSVCCTRNKLVAFYLN